MIPAVAALHAALDQLAAVEVDALPGDGAAEVALALAGVESRLAAQRARVLSRVEACNAWADDGYRSAASWLAHRGGLSRRHARHELRTARVLRRLPATAAALADGSLGLDAARAIVRAHDARTADALARDEATLVAQARRLDVVAFERVICYWQQHADPDGVEDAAAERRAQRRVYCVDGLDGVFVDGWLPTTDGAIFRKELERLEHDLFLDDWKAARAEHGDSTTSAHVCRTPAQRRADALVEMATRSAAMPPGARRPSPSISVLVGYETFAGRVCELASGQVVSPGEVAPLLDDAVIERVVFDGPSRVIDVGKARFFTGALRRAIQIRDRTCTEPGCHEPADRCEIDHVQPAAVSGPTTQTNGTLRCRFHHRRRHRTADPRPPPDP
jgi:hypothetical protein